MRFEQGSAPAIRKRVEDGKRYIVWEFTARRLKCSDPALIKELIEAGAKPLDPMPDESGKTVEPTFEFPFDPGINKDSIAQFMADTHEFEVSVHQTKDKMLEDIKAFLTKE